MGFGWGFGLVLVKRLVLSLGGEFDSAASKLVSPSEIGRFKSCQNGVSTAGPSLERQTRRLGPLGGP